jgi:hypothetical protein
MRQVHGLTFIALVLMATGGCQPASSTPAVPKESATAAQKHTEMATDPKQTAAVAKEAMFKALFARLQDVMSRSGPVAAIEVCSSDAPRIAAQIAKQFDVQIGRTSFRLRNSKNTAPDWVRPVIKGQPTQPQFVDLPEHHTGAVFPIVLKAQCLVCHGPREQISEDVQAQLKRLYPDDQATGFNEGDLRGWFWVDVPPERNVAPDSDGK